MVILKTEALTKIYGKGPGMVTALENAALSVEQGEFIAIVGTSGSGKSTLLHLLGGLDRPTSGKVFVENKDIFSLKDEALTIFRRRKIGFVFQAFNLIPTLNTYENVVFPIQLDGNSIDEKYVGDVIQSLGLSKLQDRLPNQLSGGQQQRVAIARALMLDPDVLFFDEPTSALDPELTKGVLKVIRGLAEEHMTMVIVTHEMAFARDVADHVIFMDGGVIVEQGPAKQVIENPQHSRTRAFLHSDS